MTRTRFCDSAGITILVRAHKRAVADGGELRLVIASGGPVARVFAITRLDLLIPLFGSLDEALAQARCGDPAVAAAAVRRAAPCQAARAAGKEVVSWWVRTG